MPSSMYPPTPRQEWFAPPFGGFDRAYFDPDRNFKLGPKAKPVVPGWEKQDVRTRWLVEWFRRLYNESNFQFTGFYLDSKDGDRKWLTKASGRAHNWTHNYAKLLQQGWGIWPIYPGFSNSNQDMVKLPTDWATTQKQRGVAAGQHIKSIIAKLPGDNAGMIVYVDNENGTVKPMLPYYRALFHELQTGHKDGRSPLRGGLYIREDFCNDILSEIPDLFLWMIDTHDGDMPAVDAKFKIVINEKTYDIEKPYLTPIGKPKADSPTHHQRFQIERYPLTRRGARYLSIGRQCTLGDWFKGDEDHPPEVNGYTKSVIYSEAEGKRLSIFPWDFNVSFVPDPRWSCAEPRFSNRSSGPIVYSIFRKGSSTVKELGLGKTVMQNTEPGAPICRVDQEVYTFDSHGNLVMTRQPVTWNPAERLSSWEAPVNIAGKEIARRVRSFSVLKTSPKETMVVCVSLHHKIHVYHKTKPNVWDLDAAERWKDDGVWDTGKLHPFTNISVVSFKTKVWLFAMQIIEHDDTLTDANLSVVAWPKTKVQQLGRALKGTSIATVATESHLLVFAIAADQQLWYAFAIQDPRSSELRWSKLEIVQGSPTARESPPKLHPHGCLSACAVSPRQIKVAAIRNDGVPIVFDFIFIPIFVAGFFAPMWVSTASKPYQLKYDDKNKLPAPGKSSVRGFTHAKGWSVNLYGDVVLTRNGKMTEMYCAGSAPDQCGILLRRIDVDEPWLRMENGLTN